MNKEEQKEYDRLQKERDKLYNKLKKGFTTEQLKELNLWLDYEIKLESYCNQ